MASLSPASSPDASRTSPMLLTPRSKIRALLATVESSDDEAELNSSKGSHGACPPRPRPRLFPELSSLGDRPREDDESDEAGLGPRPRGKLASRMHATTSDTANQPDDAPQVRDETVQGRVGSDIELMDDGMADADIDDDPPVISVRSRKRRSPPRSPTSRNPTSPPTVLSSPVHSIGHDHQSDNDLPSVSSSRFTTLHQRGGERVAPEALPGIRQADGSVSREQEPDIPDLGEFESDQGNDDGITDDEGGRRLTQALRPPRKASKKAIEEMTRETQRMARNMQLTHEAKTRKKVSKASLFEKFNYKPSIQGQRKTGPNSSSHQPSSPRTDAETGAAEDTPPSSPPPSHRPDQAPAQPELSICSALPPRQGGAEEETEATADQQDRSNGSARAAAMDAESRPSLRAKRRVRVQLPALASKTVVLGSDDELGVATTKRNKKIDAIFDKIPINLDSKSRSLMALKALAQVKSPGKKEGRRRDEQASMTASELTAQLQERARQQAKLERDRRIETLKARGVVLQSVDERERQEQEVEDMVEKARKEAQSIMLQERAAAKGGDGNNEGERDPLDWDDSDAEYQDASSGSAAEQSDIALSGSEEDGEELGEEEEEEEEEEEAGGEGGEQREKEEHADDESGLADARHEGSSFIANEEAAEDSTETEDEAEVEPSFAAGAPDGGVQEMVAVRHKRARNRAVVLSDDENEPKATPRPKLVTISSTPSAPPTVLRSSKKTFIPGLPVQGPAGLGLTQIFAGTMDDSRMSGSIDWVMPDVELPPPSDLSASIGESLEDLVLDSQAPAVSSGAADGIQPPSWPLSRASGLGCELGLGTNTQQSDETAEPSQDVGLQDHTPLKERFVDAAPFSTVETVVAVQQDQDKTPPHDSPLVRRGRLRRRLRAMSVEEQEVIEATAETADKPHNAFTLLAGAARKAGERQPLVNGFDRKKTKAREMVEEQAEESEDEYAGLGGADGDVSDNESIGSLDGIIDDNDDAAGNGAGDGNLAAFYADRERAEDERKVERLFKDITSGALRRKRGAGYDLSDSDDGGEARRRAKRRQFAKMQRALFADERVKKMAQDPGNEAFLRTLEDRGSDDDDDDDDGTNQLLEPAEDGALSAARSTSTSQRDSDTEPGRQTVPDSQPRRRRRPRPRRPSAVIPLREALSDLLEEQAGGWRRRVRPSQAAGSDDDNNDDEDMSGGHAPGLRAGAVVDRIRLQRNASAPEAGHPLRPAFAAPASASSSFKVPTLSRRATASFLVATTAAAAAATTPGPATAAKTVRAPGKPRCGAACRGPDAGPAMGARDRRRELRKAKSAQRRLGLVGGLLAGGSFA